MTDKNGVEIKTGDIVEITGAYFKNDNGLYFVEHSPSDPSWCGSDHSLIRISRKGKISTAKRNICFWPISIFISDRQKAAEGRRWNEAHARIEVKTIENMEEVAAFFQYKADGLAGTIKKEIWDYGEDSERVKKDKAILAHYEAVARYVAGKE